MNFKIISSLGGPYLYLVDENNNEHMRVKLPKELMHEVAIEAVREVIHNGTPEQRLALEQAGIYVK